MKVDSTGQRILVIGSGGGVGRQMCAEVARQCGPGALVLGDYRLQRAQSQASEFPGATSQWVDLRYAASIRDALAPELTAVIVCTLQEQPGVQIACLEAGIPCLDVTIGQDLIAQIHELDQPAGEAGVALLTMAGMWPGLSGLMAMRAAGMLDSAAAIDLALCQNTRSNVGPTGLVDMMKAFSRPVMLHEGTGAQEVPGFSVERSFEYPQPRSLPRLLPKPAVKRKGARRGHASRCWALPITALQP